MALPIAVTCHTSPSDDAAFHHIRSAFTAEGEPVHFHASYAVLADLAAAAARIGRSGDVAPLLNTATRALGGNTSLRLASLLHRAAALSAAEEAERHFRAALEVERWPFEHAQQQQIVRLASRAQLRDLLPAE
ncbi:hypothetical protein [Amycolatopsis pithecellobii]|uniref:Uncharacterized protein n=1 Tax=Amycolatopsis pithecellobii TaxID=664692 RepID=A0A6N7Z324_9PSEU|nr:hypothetical protein [Amycolatopsis pithecellobii]MTD53226.1 hypothetical protein [Amycolatopsis pithecellobii]